MTNTKPDQPECAGERRHKWFFYKLLASECCENCGIVRNDHNGFHPCRGPVRAGLRDGYHGHMTLTDGSHVPLTEAEAAAIWESVERATAERNAKYPDEKACLAAISDAVQRLRDFGWSDAVYCPKDGSVFDVIEAGSTGIHKCSYGGKWPDGSWWIHADGDMWPSRPILYRRTPRTGEK